MDKKIIYDIISYVVKEYTLKNHKSDFTEYTYTNAKGDKVSIHVIELTQKPTFIKKITEAKETVADNAKWRVDVPSLEELDGVRIFQTYNGCTFAIRSDGDIVNVCAKMDENGHALDNMEAVMAYAVIKGGDRLDSFDGNWRFYRKCGFEPREWIGFDESFGEEIGEERNLPSGLKERWDKATQQDYKYQEEHNYTKMDTTKYGETNQLEDFAEMGAVVSKGLTNSDYNMDNAYSYRVVDETRPSGYRRVRQTTDDIISANPNRVKLMKELIGTGKNVDIGNKQDFIDDVLSRLEA